MIPDDTMPVIVRYGGEVDDLLSEVRDARFLSRDLMRSLQPYLVSYAVPSSRYAELASRRRLARDCGCGPEDMTTSLASWQKTRCSLPRRRSASGGKIRPG